jgi:hypothetical protein
LTYPEDPASTKGSKDAPADIRAFLIADVRGYTLFTQERGDEAAAKLLMLGYSATTEPRKLRTSAANSSGASTLLM